MFTFTVEGCPFEVLVTDHAMKRMRQREVNEFAAYGSLVSIGEELLDMQNNTKFCLMDKALNTALLCVLSFEKDAQGLPLLVIHMITVLDSSAFHVKQDTVAYEISL